jgi:hypothetical protein
VPILEANFSLACWRSGEVGLLGQGGTLKAAHWRYLNGRIPTGLDAEQHLVDEVSQGLPRPTVSSEVKRLSCAFSRERILLCCIETPPHDLADLAG